MHNLRRVNVWTIALAFLIASATAILALKYVADYSVKDSATIVGPLLTAFGLFLAFSSLREGHEWNRRHFTVGLILGWNTQAREHLAVLTQEFPDFFQVPDFIKNPEAKKSWAIESDRAKRIVRGEFDSTPGSTSDADMKIRNSLVALMNYFEYVATAYKLHIVDREAVRDSFGSVMLDVWIYFYPCIAEMRHINRRDPWPPLTYVITEWERAETRSYLEKRAHEAAAEHEKLLKEGGARERTGI
jgi:hypothetical protein